MKTKLIDTLIADSIFVEIYDDNAEESFFGYIIQHTDNFLQLEAYDDEGRLEGIFITEFEEVSRIRWEGNERQLIESLISSRAEQPKPRLEGMRSILEDVNQHYGHICITLGGYGTDKLYIGEIEELNEDFLVLHEYGSRQQKCRNRMLVRIEDISRVQAGGIYESNLIKQLEANQSE
jgi:hypothetical protein